MTIKSVYMVLPPFLAVKRDMKRHIYKISHGVISLITASQSACCGIPGYHEQLEILSGNHITQSECNVIIKRLT